MPAIMKPARLRCTGTSPVAAPAAALRVVGFVSVPGTGDIRLGNGVIGVGVSRICGTGPLDGISWRARNPPTPPCAST